MQLPLVVLRDIAGLLPTTTMYTGVGPTKISPWTTLSDALLQKTCAAALSIQEELHRTTETAHEIYEKASFGFIAVDAALAAQLRHTAGFRLLNGDFTFGAAILISRGEKEGQQSLQRIITVAGEKFPVIEITGTVIRDGMPPSPNHVSNAGTSTCWAEARSPGGAWNNGIITAGHVVNTVGLGASVKMLASTQHGAPTISTLANLGGNPIDAAVLKITQSKPQGLTLLATLDPAIAPIAPGMAMELIGRHTMSNGIVLRVNQNPGYYGHMLAERIVYDTPSVPGDSGGLVSDGTKRQGLGIHMGTIPSTTGAARDGVAQGLWQATEWFKADIWG